MLQMQGHATTTRAARAQVPRVSASHAALAGVARALPGLPHVHEEGVGESQLPLAAHGRARYVARRQAHGLGRMPFAKFERRGHHGSRTRLGVKAIRVAQVDQPKIRDEGFGDALLQRR